MKNYIPNANRMRYEKFIGALFDKSKARFSKEQILRAMPKNMRISAFRTLTEDSTDAVYEIIFEQMNKPVWYVHDMAVSISEGFDISYNDALRIVRTETQTLANRAREIQFKKDGGYKNSLYIWDGIEDERTSMMCHTIRNRTPSDGLPLEQLKQLVNTTSHKYGNKLNRDWSTHPNCRSYLRRVR